ISRRTSRTRDVFSSWPDARWKRRLNCSFFSLASCSSSWSAVMPRTSSDFISLPRLAGRAPYASTLARHDARLDRQLGGAEQQRLARHRIRHAVELEHDATRLDASHPQLGRTLAGAHANL